jgi:DNA-binding CsgD family transcriptional regulator
VTLLQLVNDLSSRERECLLWAARGKTYIETAMITGIAYGTVKSNLDSARYKLNCATLAQATALAVAEGIFTSDDLKGR